MILNCNDVAKKVFILQLKHDYEDCRVMYREGLDGSPFHTLLVEGYMDGPIEDCKLEFRLQISMF